MFIEIPDGTNELITIEKNEACRVGSRIKEIREARKLTRAELGEKLGLTADRIQKYENGVRKPKVDMIIKIAEILDVNALALVDASTASFVSIMFGFLKIKKKDFKLEMIDNKICLSVDKSNAFYEHLEKWFNRRLEFELALENAKDTSEKELLIAEYEDWKWNYPKSTMLKSNKTQKAHLRNEIERLQALYDSIDGEDV